MSLGRVKQKPRAELAHKFARRPSLHVRRRHMGAKKNRKAAAAPKELPGVGVSPNMTPGVRPDYRTVADDVLENETRRLEMREAQEHESPTEMVETDLSAALAERRRGLIAKNLKPGNSTKFKVLIGGLPLLPWSHRAATRTSQHGSIAISAIVATAGAQLDVALVRLPAPWKSKWRWRV